MAKRKTEEAAKQAVANLRERRVGIYGFIDRISDDIAYFGHINKMSRELYTQTLKSELQGMVFPVEGGNIIIRLVK